MCVFVCVYVCVCVCICVCVHDAFPCIVFVYLLFMVQCMHECSVAVVYSCATYIRICVCL